MALIESYWKQERHSMIAWYHTENRENQEAMIQYQNWEFSSGKVAVAPDCRLSRLDRAV